jgi:TolA-binding protein
MKILNFQMRNERNGFLRPTALAQWPLLFLCAGLLLPGILHAAKSDEDKAFSSARALFDDHQYNLAETYFSNYLAAPTNSYRPYAILYLARARLEQSNYDSAILLLSNSLAQSGELAGEYTFWMASARLDKGQYAQAAEGFARVRDLPNNARQLEAACDEAEAYAKMENWPRVIELLQKPDNAFSRLAAVDPKNSIVTRGLLLLGQAYLAAGRYAEGQDVIRKLDPGGVGLEWQWPRQYLLCRLELAGGRVDEAWQNSTNLLETATGLRQEAASRFLRGEILEKLGGHTAEALQSYTNNLAAALPPDDQRRALLKGLALILAQNQIQDAVQLLENYVTQRTNGAALDLARLRLGELYLKIYFHPAPDEKTNDLSLAATNFLAEAQTNFEIVISNFPASSNLVAQARLDRGWCEWAQTNMVAAKADFQAAVTGLPRPSPEQAVALFKLADAEFYLQDFKAALTNYNSLLQQYAGVESVTNGLFDQALYQIVQSSLAVGDLAGAETALRKILDWYPNSLFGDRSQLLIGESKRYDYAMARQVFNNLLQRSPHTPLRPEVEFAIARTYEQQGNWQEAVREYELWLGRHASDVPLLLPRVEYSRALAYGKAGMETNALALFTNFVARFRSNSLAPWAQNWVADYYYNQGDNQSAEQNYQLLEKLPNAGDLASQALLMAGRAALAGQRAGDAQRYFADLVNNTNAPSDLIEQAYFALGDTILQQWQGSPTNGALLDQAIQAISKLTNGAPTNDLSIQAYGRLGDYYMQWADRQWDTKHDVNIYTNAAQMYVALLSFPAADVDAATRSQAEVALGRIAEQQQQPEEALAHYCKVLYGDMDHFDPFWVEQAGKAAAHIYEQREQWDRAITVYQRVLKAVPSLRPTLEKAIASAQTQADRARN